MPIKGSRQLYKIPQIQVGANAAGTGGRAIIVKMKEPVGDFFDLEPISFNDPQLIGTFGGSGTNAGYKYVKRLGGFRYKSFTIVAKRRFLIQEVLFDILGVGVVTPKLYQSISVGFPKGVTVRQFLIWLQGTGKSGEVDHVITPSGTSVSLGPADPAFVPPTA